MNKELNISELNSISKAWLSDDKKLYSENDIFDIDVNLVLNNMWFEPNSIKFEDIVDKKMFERLTKKNSNEKYYIVIGIGKMDEIFVHTGNHRIAMLNGNDTDITKICCKLKYVNFPHGYKEIKQLPSGKRFIPYGLIPKWKQSEVQEG